MGIEDPVWGKIIIVLGFIAVLIGLLYFTRLKGKKIFSQLSSNEYLRIDETISISNISKVSLITAINSKYLIVHGRGQSPSIITLQTDDISKQNFFHTNKERASWIIITLKLINYTYW